MFVELFILLGLLVVCLVYYCTCYLMFGGPQVIDAGIRQHVQISLHRGRFHITHSPTLVSPVFVPVICVHVCGEHELFTV